MQKNKQTKMYEGILEDYEVKVIILLFAKTPLQMYIIK